jgi:membrane protein
MFQTIWALIKAMVSGFIEHDALSRGASIAYFTLFSLAPLLIIVIAIASLVFGYEASQQAIVGQFSGLMGTQTADALQSMLQGANLQGSGTLATVIGLVTLLITATGALSEIQWTLNTTWNAKPQAGLSSLVRVRIVSLGLILTLGFLMLVSLVISAGLTAVGKYLNAIFPGGQVLLAAANFVVSLALLAAVFAAIFKILPDKQIAWRDVAIGAIATALLFTIGKSLIGLYIGSSQIASGYGAAGSLIVLLVWLYYSSLIFLLGAEFTRAYAEAIGSYKGDSSTGVTNGTDPLPSPRRAAPSANVLESDTASTRSRMDEIWTVMRDRSTNSPSVGDVS